MSDTKSANYLTHSFAYGSTHKVKVGQISQTNKTCLLSPFSSFARFLVFSMFLSKWVKIFTSLLSLIPLIFESSLISFLSTLRR